MKLTRFLIACFPLLCFVACNEKEADITTKSEDEITFTYALDGGSLATKAYSAYHTETAIDDLTSVLVCVRNAMSGAPETLVAKKYYESNTSSNAIFWDDVSNNTYDVRASGATVNIWAARLAGKTESASGVTIDGKLTWKVEPDQATNGSASSDLLAADYQSGYTASTSAVPLCFHHAMSKVTVNIKKKAENSGFEDAEITNNPSVTLNQPNTTAAVDLTKKKAKTDSDSEIETGFVAGSKETTPLDVKMHKMSSATSGYLVSFDAIVAPDQVIKVGDKIATITITDANSKTNVYDLKASKKLMAGWLSTTEDAVADDATITFKYGVNYVINATISKQEITISATITDWTNVTAGGEGVIQFINDVTTTGTIADALKGGFDVYKNGVKSTTVSWDTANDKWVYDPVIYWDGQSDASYFRALSPAGTSADISQGTDVLWGTSGTDAIQPRTGDVPLKFEHALSSITVNLSTVSGAAAVDLSEAKLSILGIYDGGTIDISSGGIAALTASSSIPIAGQTAISGYPVIPQSLLCMSDGTSRTGAVTFYIPSDLTTIYTNGTSISDGSIGTSYATETLVAVTYEADDAKAYNANLTGAKSENDPIFYTWEEYKELQPYANITETEFNTLPDADKTKPAVYYTQDEIDAAKAIVNADGYVTGSDPDAEEVAKKTTSDIKEAARLYTWEEYKALKPYSNMSETEFNALTEEQRTKAKYTDAEAAAYNATLPGAVKAGDFKNYRIKTSAEGTSKKANVGDVKTIGDNPKVVLHIVLKDNTSYAIDLATCTDGSNAITTWSRGTSYTYTITLSKEQITFRALVKDWVEASGGGNANLDWD